MQARNGTLYRFDTVASAPVAVEADLNWAYCRTAPSIAGLGGYGAFLVCDGTNPLRVRYIKLD